MPKQIGLLGECKYASRLSTGRSIRMCDTYIQHSSATYIQNSEKLGKATLIVCYLHHIHIRKLTLIFLCPETNFHYMFVGERTNFCMVFAVLRYLARQQFIFAYVCKVLTQ